jgi:acyl-CoA reductase-like NAD-dependent aldehyde dehydrogenase
VGRPRAYCRRSCRQRAFEARRAAEELDWSANRVREAHRVIDDVAVIAAALSDAVAQRTVGPVDELRAEDVDELLDRVRRIAEDLQRRIDVTGHSTDDDSDVVGGRQETRSGSSGT